MFREAPCKDGVMRVNGRLRVLIFLITLIGGLRFFGGLAWAVPVDPQYLLVNKTPTGCPPDSTLYCWFPQDPTTLDPRAIDEIRERLPTNGTVNRKLGVSFSVWLLDLSQDIQIQDKG